MAAPAVSTLDIIKSALRKLGVLGAGQSAPRAEDTELALDEFNGIVEQKNLRAKNCGFERQQAFTFTVARETYSIGALADTPNFVVTSGMRPTRIDYAKLVMTSGSTDLEIDLAVWNVDMYEKIPMPTLASDFPTGIYYQATNPNGTVRPYPASPASVSDQLKLWWTDQLLTVAIADISTALVLAQGYRRGLALSLAVACWPAFAKKTDLQELKRQEREVWLDIGSLNAPAPKIASTDGIQPAGSGFDYRSRTWI